MKAQSDGKDALWMDSDGCINLNGYAIHRSRIEAGGDKR